MNILLYENIKKRRKELKMTQEELAIKVGYADKGMISRIEAGKVDISQSQLLKFATALSIAPADLMGWNNNNESSPKIILSDDEEVMITKFRALDARGKNNVLDTLEREYSYTDEAQRGTA